MNFYTIPVAFGNNVSSADKSVLRRDSLVPYRAGPMPPVEVHDSVARDVTTTLERPTEVQTHSTAELPRTR